MKRPLIFGDIIMENLNIFSSKGFITRSGFFAAYLIISLVISFFSMLGSVLASESSGEFNFICYLIAIIGCLMGTYLILANLIKRINDIKEKKNIRIFIFIFNFFS